MALLLALRLFLDTSPPPGALCTADADTFEGLRRGVPMCRRRVTTEQRLTAFARAFIPRAQWPAYELDHFLPLCLGGSNDLANLWPEPIAHARRKDVLEQSLCRALAAGRLSQAQALEEIRRWGGVSLASQSRADAGFLPRIGAEESPTVARTQVRSR